MTTNYINGWFSRYALIELTLKTSTMKKAEIQSLFLAKTRSNSKLVYKSPYETIIEVSNEQWGSITFDSKHNRKHKLIVPVVNSVDDLEKAIGYVTERLKRKKTAISFCDRRLLGIDNQGNLSLYCLNGIFSDYPKVDICGYDINQDNDPIKVEVLGEYEWQASEE